jgi:predicted unusual protein kinase regulating ubiquinone biosynthesis (AarF/ABC1/UbiB family)
MFQLRCLVRVTEKLTSLVTKQRAFSVALLDSFAAASLQELDYLNEAANQEKFRQELGNN